MPVQYDYWWIWCVMLVMCFGGCIGSFLNVIIYRLPRDVPFLRERPWSFCPTCDVTIKWYDNIPVISYFLLRGRCRQCRCQIPPRYVIVEVMTIAMFLILFDAFFVSHLLNGIEGPHWSVAYRFQQDWPIYAAHVILFSSLLAMSAIDMEHYWVDIRFTRFAAVCGFAIHTIWTPAHSTGWPRPGPTLGAAAIAATIGALVLFIITSVLWRRRSTSTEEQHQSDAPEDQPSEHAADPAPASEAPPRTFPPTAWLAGLVLYLTLALLVVVLLQEPPDAATKPFPLPGTSLTATPDSTFALRALPAMLFMFFATVGGGMIKRESDKLMEETIEAERDSARRVVLTEFAVLLVPMAMFACAWFLMRPQGPLNEFWQECWSWRARHGIGPVAGLATAAAGFVIASAIGWAVRIVFTLLLGKEAFGTGDIYILAAAGAVVGWEVVAVAFFMAAVLALVGLIFTLPFKRGRMLPMGPWLTLAFFVTLLMREPAIESCIKPLNTIWQYLVR